MKPLVNGTSAREAEGLLPRSVLVAEDEHLVAVDLVEQLRGLGIEVIGPAASGDDAVDLARKQTPDLALLDIRMPGMDGLEAAGVLFGEMGIPIVMLSAYSEPAYAEAGARIGVFGYLLKPVTIESLRVNLTVAWGRHRHDAALRGELQALKQALEDRKVIERAKGVLMKRLDLTEDAAMKRLQKQARDSRRKLADLARAIIETNDVLARVP